MYNATASSHSSKCNASRLLIPRTGCVRLVFRCALCCCDGVCEEWTSRKPCWCDERSRFIAATPCPALTDAPRPSRPSRPSSPPAHFSCLLSGLLPVRADDRLRLMSRLVSALPSPSPRLASSSGGSTRARTPRVKVCPGWRSARRAGRGSSRGRTFSTSSGE